MKCRAVKLMQASLCFLDGLYSENEVKEKTD